MQAAVVDYVDYGYGGWRKLQKAEKMMMMVKQSFKFLNE